MPGFVFGTVTTTSAPAASALNTSSGTAPKLLFGTPATTAQSTGLFGSPAPAGGLFGTPPKTTTATGGIFGVTPLTTTSTATGGLFGSTATTVTTAASLFGTTTTSATGSLFGKPTTTAGFFGGSAAGSVGFSTAGGTATTFSAVGLGGTGTLTTTGSIAGNSLGVAGAAASGSPMESEIPQAILDLLNLLRDQIKKNYDLSDEFAMNNSDSFLSIDEKLDELFGIRVKYADSVRQAKDRANELLEKMQRDVRAAEQVRRRQKEISKNPQFSRKQALSYLSGICTEHEEIVREFWQTLQILEEKINAKLNKQDVITKQDLQQHFEHYDQAFKMICSDVYRCQIQVRDLKDAFLENRKRTAPYTPNPFEQKRRSRIKLHEETRLAGADAFPSQMTMMKIGEMAKSSAVNQQTATTATGFGTSSSLFGSKPFGSATFSFNQPAQSTAAPLFKPFSSATSTSAPLFGSSSISTAGAPPPAPTTTSSFTFGNTLNSSVSGTLFGGSARKPFG